MAAGIIMLLAGMLTLGTAEATLQAVEQAYELHLDQIVLPAAVGGNVIVRPCVACRPVTLTTTAASRFLVRRDGTPFGLAEFARAVDAARRRAKPMIYVYYAPGTKRVNRIVLSAGDRVP